MSRESNILDPIHGTLDARIWDDPASEKPRLKTAHAHFIKRVIYHALKTAGYTDVEKWLNLVLTGSLTTFQYSDESDVDVSLFVDSKVFPEWSRAEMIALMVDKVDGTTLPGTPFPLQDFVVAEGIKASDLYKPGLRSGYDIDTNRWIVPPEPTRVHDVKSEQGGFYAWALQMADKMERLIRYEPDQAVKFWHSIHKKRQRDMRAGKGDYVESNIIYKMLANRGLFPQISGISGEYIAKVGAFDPEQWTTDEPCYLTADALSREHPEWEYQAGHYVHPEGWTEPHAWVRHRGTQAIFDPTHEQFDPEMKSVMAEPGHSHYDRYHSWAEHPDQDASWADELGDDDPLLWMLRGRRGARPGPRKYIAKTGGWLSSYPMGFQTMYHVSPRKNRESILEHGLQGHEEGRREKSLWNYDWPQPAGNYLFDRLEHAQEYMHHLHQQNGKETPEEERYEFPDPPADFNDWPDEAKEEWEEEHWDELREKHDDPHGYDIYSVQTHGLPIAPDPETSLTPSLIKGERKLWDLGDIHDAYNDPNIVDPQSGYDPHADMGDYYGMEPRRYYIPQQIHPGRLSLAEHIPSWHLTPENAEEAMDYEDQIPQPWMQVPFTERPMPGHESKTARGREVAKFVYHPESNRLLIGEMGRNEGEKPTHSQLLEHPMWNWANHNPAGVMFGEIARNGYADIFSRRFAPSQGHMNPWQKQYMTEEAVRRAVPGVRFTRPTELLNPAWELADDPAVIYAGEPPMVNEEPEDTRWKFGATNFSPLVNRIYGETVEKGGSTVDLQGNDPESRYGYAPDLSTQTPVSLDEFSPADVAEFIDRFKDRLEQPGKFVGTWIHDGKVYLDVTEGEDDYDTAFQNAWNGHQKAMYDAVKQEDVPVRGLDYEQPLTTA